MEALVISETHTTELPAGGGICDRTEQVCTANLAQITGIDTCDAFADAYLAAIAGVLDLSQASISSLQAGRFLRPYPPPDSMSLSRNELIAL